MMLTSARFSMPPLSDKVEATGGSTFVANSTIRGAGRGLFSARAFEAGEHIAREPLLELGSYDIASDIFRRYAFADGEGAYIVLGVTSLINSAERSDGGVNVHWRRASPHWVDVFAISHISAGEELKFDYGRAVRKHKTGQVRETLLRSR